MSSSNGLFGSSSGKGMFSVPRQTKASQYAANVYAMQHAAAHHSGGGGLLGGVGGFIGNLGSDVISTVAGLPAGVVHTAEHPVGTAKQIWAVEKQQWSPLLHGHVHQFLHDFYEHPLGPILDVAGVLTGGAGLAAKGLRLAGATGLADAGRGIELTTVPSRLGTASRDAHLAEGGGSVKKLLDPNPMIRLREQLGHQISIRLPSQTPLVGESARATRALGRIAEHGGAEAKNIVDEFTRKVQGIRGAAQIAFHAFNTGMRPDERLADLEGQLHRGDVHIPDQTRRLLSDPKANQLYDEAIHAYKSDPAGNVGSRMGKKIVKAYNETRKVVAIDREIAGVPADIAKQRDYLHLLLIKHGARFAKPAYEGDIGGLGVFEHASIPGAVTKTNAKALGKTSSQEEYLARLDHLQTTHESAAELIKHESAWRQAHNLPEPVYMPDKGMLDARTLGGRGAKGMPQVNAQMRHFKNNGTMALAGVIAHDPLKLAEQTLKHIQWQHKNDIANMIQQHASVWAHEVAPKGHSFVSKTALDHVGQAQADMAKFAKELDQPGMAERLRAELTSKGTDSAAGVEGHRLIVPDKLVNHLTKDYERSGTFTRRFLEKPTQVWKHIVLAGRPLPFITNNVVGNTIMHALRHGVRGVHATLGAHHEEALMQDLHGEMVHTFGSTEAPKMENKLARTMRAVAYEPVSAHEHILRRSALVTELKKEPLVQAELKKLKAAGYKSKPGPGGFGDKSILHEAATRAYAKHPGLRERMSKLVADSMGDYQNYSKLERNIKNIVPFYGWNRHAVRAYYRLLTDKPLTAAAMTAVGAVGAKQKPLGDVPAFMRAYLPANLTGVGIGHKGFKTVINTNSLNPEQTVADTLNALAAVALKKPNASTGNEIGSTLNPIFQSLVEGITGKSLLTGAPLKHNALDRFGALGQGAGNTLENLPQARLMETIAGLTKPGTSLSDRFTPTGRPKAARQPTLSGDWQTLMQDLAGIPVKEVNPKAAQAWEKSIKTKAAGTGPHVAKKRASKKKAKPWSTSTSSAGGGLFG